MAKGKPKKIVDKPTSGHSNKETVSIGWCDNGMVEGRFATGIIATMTEGQKAAINVVNHLRVNGNQIARQRQALFDAWEASSQSRDHRHHRKGSQRQAHVPLELRLGRHRPPKHLIQTIQASRSPLRQNDLPQQRWRRSCGRLAPHPRHRPRPARSGS